MHPLIFEGFYVLFLSADKCFRLWRKLDTQKKQPQGTLLRKGFLMYLPQREGAFAQKKARMLPTHVIEHNDPPTERRVYFLCSLPAI